jgi:hypothetical protein
MMDRAPEATVEALMYSLRRGVSELTQPNTLRRLSELSETEIGDVCDRAQNFKPRIASPWSSDEIATMIEVWDRLRM